MVDANRTAPKPYPPADRLRSVFSYEPATGVIQWRYRDDKDAAWNAYLAGKEAGCITPNGYKRIRLDGRALLYHRVAWIVYYGADPGQLTIDHKNCDPLDNRIDNLRLASSSNQGANKRRPSRDLKWPRGVVFDKSRGRFFAMIRPGNGAKRKSLGRFKTPQEAHAAYCAAAQKYHGDFCRTD